MSAGSTNERLCISTVASIPTSADTEHATLDDPSVMSSVMIVNLRIFTTSGILSRGIRPRSIIIFGNQRTFFRFIYLCAFVTVMLSRFTRSRCG